jgi:hypothetical protein
MTPNEKAKELFYKMYNVKDPMNGYPMCFDTAKQCALIAVDEIISSSPSLPILGDGGIYGEDIELSTKYWQEVKQEIEKL